MTKGHERSKPGEFKEASTEVIGRVNELVSKALGSIGGIESVFNNESPFGKVDWSVWTKFRSTLTDLCTKENLGLVIQIGMDKEAHKVRSVTLLKKDGDFVTIDVE